VFLRSDALTYFTVLATALYGALWLLLWRRRYFAANREALGMLLFLAGTALVTMAVRVRFGEYQAGSFRYRLFSLVHIGLLVVALIESFGLRRKAVGRLMALGGVAYALVTALGLWNEMRFFPRDHRLGAWLFAQGYTAECLGRIVPVEHIARTLRDASDLGIYELPDQREVEEELRVDGRPVAAPEGAAITGQVAMAVFLHPSGRTFVRLRSRHPGFALRDHHTLVVARTGGAMAFPLQVRKPSRIYEKDLTLAAECLLPIRLDDSARIWLVRSSSGSQTVYTVDPDRPIADP
jgi:hypothetical protein